MGQKGGKPSQFGPCQKIKGDDASVTNKFQLHNNKGIRTDITGKIESMDQNDPSKQQNGQFVGQDALRQR